MSNLESLTVEQAASKAIEVLLYAEYQDMLQPTKYRQGYEGSFEEYVSQEYGSDYVNAGDASFDSRRLWEHMKYEGSEGSVDGLTAKVEAEYGGEGQGDQYWMVISISDGETTRYFRRDGWYASFHGGELDTDTSEVKPAEKVITVYE